MIFLCGASSISQSMRVCAKCMCSPYSSSRIFSRTAVSWSRNQCPPILSIPETFRFEDFFQWCVLSFLGVSMSSHLSFGLPLGLFPIITSLSIDSSSLLMPWPNNQSLLLNNWTMCSILLCLFRSSFLSKSYLVNHCIILITFMSAVLAFIVKVQHSLPKIRIGLKGALYRIQILRRRYTFWSYPAGLTIADPPG